MSLFKNKVGRPSNETLKKRRIVYASVTVVAISLVVVGVFFLYGDFNKKDIVSNEKNIKSNSLKYGDANNDGKVTIDDATAVQNAISGKTKLTDKGMQQADVDGDKKLSQSDVKIIQNYLAGVFKTLPVKVGDVNTDGKVDSTDRDLLDKYIAGDDVKLSTAGYILADLNGDGKVKSRDALILDRHIAKHSGYEVLPVLASNVTSVSVPK